MAFSRFSAFFCIVLLAAAPAGAESTTPVAQNFVPAAANANNPTPSGIWLHDNKRIKIEIYACGDRLCAKLVWFKWPDDAQGLPLVDVKNVDPKLRSRPLLGLVVLYGLRRTADNEWEDGKIYNPDDGVDYDASMSIAGDNTLRVRAYVLLPLLGHTLVWTRVPS